jgi:hypothetical protein
VDFWVMTSCSMVGIYQPYGRTQLPPSSGLNFVPNILSLGRECILHLFIVYLTLRSVSRNTHTHSLTHTYMYTVELSDDWWIMNWKGRGMEWPCQKLRYNSDISPSVWGKQRKSSDRLASLWAKVWIRNPRVWNRRASHTNCDVRPSMYMRNI